MAETRGNYESIQEVMDSMPCELGVTSTFIRRHVLSSHHYYVLQSKNNDELQRHLRDPSIPITRIPTGITDKDFSFWLSDMHSCLVQIWAPVSIGDKKYLTTSDQPFVLGTLDRGPCSYRKHCLDYLIPINNDVSSSDPPGRVFRNGLPEFCLNIKQYTSIEYPLRDKALNSGIFGSYLAFPFGKSYDEYRYGSVVEVVLGDYVRVGGLWEFDETILNLKPETFAVGGPVPIDLNICDQLSAIWGAHGLSLVQTWFSASEHNNEAFRTTPPSYPYRGPAPIELICFVELSFNIKKGRGVAGKAFSSKGACFCKDITQLSIDEYSMLPNARETHLTSCFAISLTHRDQWRDSIFIVEFFLPGMVNENGDPRTLIKKLVSTMKEHLKGFRVASGQELGENLFVEVIKTSPTDKLDSFEIGAGVDNTLVLSGGARRTMDYEKRANVPLDGSNQNELELLHPAGQSSSVSSGQWFQGTTREDQSSSNSSANGFNERSWKFPLKIGK